MLFIKITQTCKLRILQRFEKMFQAKVTHFFPVKFESVITTGGFHLEFQSCLRLLKSYEVG